MCDLHEVDRVSVHPPLLPLAGQRQREVEELCGPGGGARHQHLPVPGQTHGAQLEAVQVDLLLYPRPPDLLDCLVRAHSVHSLRVRGETQIGERAGLYNNLRILISQTHMSSRGQQRSPREFWPPRPCSTRTLSRCPRRRPA